MIICDKCKKEIKWGEGYTSIRHDYEQKHYCRKCSPINYSTIIGIVGLVFLVILVVILISLLVLWTDGL